MILSLGIGISSLVTAQDLKDFTVKREYKDFGIGIYYMETEYRFKIGNDKITYIEEPYYWKNLVSYRLFLEIEKPDGKKTMFFDDRMDGSVEKIRIIKGTSDEVYPKGPFDELIMKEGQKMYEDIIKKIQKERLKSVF